MLLSMFRYIKGYLKIRVVGYSPERFLNACSYRGIYLWGITPAHGSYEMYVSVSGFRKLKPIIKKTGTKVTIIKRIGLPFYLFRYRKRKIFFAGAALSIAMIYILSLFVWNIDIRGNRKYTDEALIAFLAEQGVEHGMRISQVDCDRIVKDIRKTYDEIIWVSASIEGCRLIVQIKENEDSEETRKVQEDTEVIQSDLQNTGRVEEGTDIVADCDGIVTEIIVRKGLPCVRVGDAVTKGQILVTGAVPVVNDAGETTGYRFQKSEADIRAQTIMDYADSCELKYEEKQYLAQRKEQAFLRIGDRILWLGSARSSFPDSEETTFINQLHIGRYFYLPVFWGNRVTVPYISETREYDKRDLQTILSEKYCRFQEELEKKGVEIIENDVKIYTESAYAQAKGTLTVITEIGTEQPATITEDVTDGDD